MVPLTSAAGTAVLRWRFEEDLRPVAALLERGGILAVPTESSYGLAVDPRSARGVAAIFALKGRAADQPLPVVIAHPRQLDPLGVEWPSEASGGLEALWPAALSLLLPLVRPLPAAAGCERLAVRVPAHEPLVDLLARLGHGLTATSANLSGSAPILDPADLDALLAGRDAMIVDGGRLAGGAPSTLVEVTDGGARILRSGRVDADTLRRAAPGLDPRPAVVGGAEADPFSAASVEIPVEESR